MPTNAWQFSIDVGGTFTDVIARRLDGTLITHKLLSTGVVRGTAHTGSTPDRIIDPARRTDPPDFWTGYTLRLINPQYAETPPSEAAPPAPNATTHIRSFDAPTGTLTLDPPLPELTSPDPQSAPLAYELYSKEPAPILAIRYLMGLRLADPIGRVDVRLGTTRATNALLERKGASVAFVTTRGFADVLRIGYQDRPHLFSLNIRKRDELYTHVIEIDERLAADGTVLKTPDAAAVRDQLAAARQFGIDAIAICLLHSHVNPAHERIVAEAAAPLGFEHISISSDVARLERIVPRGDTTVVDAYLAPVVRDYIARLRTSMPDAHLRLMTNNGGLVAAESATGKDLLLSGPAGGVVGCRHVARQAGFDRAIGFDMGGTSTDVCRIDAPPREFEYQHETVKAGVRIMTPMLAVETVAAGGGSICTFDGQKLVVGPESAGADPGPACYGRGGPLTVTDMNVFLGRVVPAFFPFPLDRSIVERKLTTLATEISRTTGTALSPIELADGFVQIANANMAAAIKQISTRKGIDVRDYVLTTFGGAGAQHACAIARSLGIPRVLCSPFAGVLSAVGIGVADVKRIAQQSVRVPLDAAAQPKLDPIFRDLTQQLQHEMAAEGIDANRLAEPHQTIDLCYTGQATTITVPADPFTEAAARFEQLHRRLYGYTHDGRPIEVRVARVTLTAPSAHTPTAAPGESTAPPKAPQTTKMILAGSWHDVPLAHRADLSTGQTIPGPAIIIEDTSTIVIEPGWNAQVLDTGDIVLTDHDPAGTADRVSTEADPIRLELFNNHFASIAEQMGHTLRRTALSVNVKERLDYSCAIFTPRGDLVVNAPHIPVHLGGMSDCVKALIEDVRTFAPGDVYVTNDPYRGGSHLNDVTVITPVHSAAGDQILFFVASRAHHAEIGGKTPGSMPPDSRSLGEEGVVIRAFPYLSAGQPQLDSLRSLLTAPPYPSRTPDENLADIAAQVAANRTGANELLAMIDHYGLHVVTAYMTHIQRAAERKMRAALAALPAGIHRFEDHLDDGSPIRLAITIKGDRATLDFSGTGPVLPGNLNANRAITTSAVLYCLRCLIDEDIPLNAGVLAPVEIVLPQCLLNPPPHDDPHRCAAVVGGNVETSQRIVDCVFGALQTVAASQGTMNNLLMGNERFGYYETICGGSGAGEGFHGADAVHTHMTNTRLTDPEVLEARVPARLIRFAIRTGSGGHGRYHGGCGVVREIDFLEPLTVSILSQRRTTAPYGLSGGAPGHPGHNRLRRAGTTIDETLPPIASVNVTPGDRLTIETPGGGACGTPDPAD